MQDPTIRREPWKEEGVRRPTHTPGVWFLEPKVVSWKAGAALALGVLSLATCGFTGALAVVFGAWALVEIGSSNGTRTGAPLAILGTVLGALTAPLSFLLLVGMLTGPPDRPPRGDAPRAVIDAPGEQISAPEGAGDVQARLTRWRSERERIAATHASFTAERRDLQQRLREQGVRSAADLADRPAARFIADELVELEKQIRLAERKLAEHDVAIARIESILRRLERRRLLAESGVSEEELRELLQTSLELDGELKQEAGVGPAVEVQVDTVLEAALREPAEPAAEER